MKSNSDTNSSFPYAALYFITFCSTGVLLVYMNLYLKRAGLSDSQLGTVAAIPSLMTIFSPPLWGMLADSVKDMRRILVVLFLGAGIVYPLLLFTNNYYFLLGIVMLTSFFYLPNIPLNDALTLDHIARYGGDYGRIRLWGSVGAASSMLIFKIILKDQSDFMNQFGYGLFSIFVFFVAFRVLGAIWSFIIPKPEDVESRKPIKWRELTKFITANLILVLTAGLIARAAMQAYYVFFSIYLDQLGIADSSKGIFWALGVASEVGMMFFVGKLIKKIGIKWTLVLSMLGMSVRLFIYSSKPPVVGILFTQLFHALTFSTFHTSILDFVSTVLPDRIRASGQTLYNAVVWGLGGVIGAKICGELSDAYGIFNMFKFSSFIALLALVITLIFIRSPRSKSGTGETGTGD